MAVLIKNSIFQNFGPNFHLLSKIFPAPFTNFCLKKKKQNDGAVKKIVFSKF